MRYILEILNEFDNYFNVDYNIRINHGNLKYHQVIKINNYYFYTSDEAIRVGNQFMLRIRSINISMQKGNYVLNMLKPGYEIEKINYIIKTHQDLIDFEKIIKEKELQDLRLKKLERIIYE